MIKISILKRDNLIFGLNYDGHANSNKYGHDIVCAGISAQVMMAINGIGEILKIPVNVDADFENGGYLKFTLDRATQEEIIKAQVLLETLVLGIKGIMYDNNNDKYITLIEEEV